MGAAVGKEPHAPQDAACATSHVEPTRRTATSPTGSRLPSGPLPSLPPPEMAEAGVAAVLDAMHSAASNADAERYFELWASDGVFIGTDPAERWPRDEFEAYARARFANGDGWRYAVRSRHVNLAPSGVAWFDESLLSDKLGSCRGVGVLVWDTEDARWLISQYALSMSIPNDAALEVASRVRQIPHDRFRSAGRDDVRV